MYDQTALLADLETSLTSRSGDWRAAALRQLTALFMTAEGQLSADHVALYDLILPRFIDRVDQRTLAEISAVLAPSRNAPPLTAERLARHASIAVAAPVLRQSASLSDAFLVDFIVSGTADRDRLVLIAERAIVSATISEALLERGDPATDRALFANRRADISEIGYVGMIDRSKTDEALRTAICSRSDLPAELRPFFEMGA